MFELDDQLINTIVKALSQESEARFQTAKDFIRAIDGKVKISRQSTQKQFLASQEPLRSDNSSKPANIVKGPGLAAVAGMDELKKQLQEEVIDP